jgi:protein-S-isoprenylcysteine O-methyltransferase Ste14
MIDPADRGLRYVLAQGALLTALVVAPAQPGLAAPRAVRLLGVVLVGGAALVGLAGFLRLGRALTPLPVPRAGSDLVTSGVYRHVRHPLYSALLVFGTGLCLRSPSLGRAAALAALALLLHRKAAFEEARLTERYSGYPDYASRTGRFLPRRARRALP